MRQKSSVYFIAFIFVTILTFLGLYFNIQTVVLNEKVKTIKKDVWRLKKENIALEIDILHRIESKNVEAYVRETLNMMPERDGRINQIRTSLNHE